jgi:hypothetical protein
MSWSAGFGASSSSSSTAAASNSNAPAPITNSNANGGYPSRNDLDRNFFPDEEDYDVVDAEEDDDYDDDLDDDEDGLGEGEGGEGGEEEELYPGIYRAMFAFDPEGSSFSVLFSSGFLCVSLSRFDERWVNGADAFGHVGTAEVALSEDQLVRVVGRGGGVGWAVVEVEWKPTPGLVKELREMGADLGGLDDSTLLDSSEPSSSPGQGVNGKTAAAAAGEGGVDVTTKDGKVRHGLVPESYLTPVKLDGVPPA